MDSLQERIDTLKVAQHKLGEVVDLIESALRDTSHETHANSYIIPHLREWINCDTFNYGIQQYIDELENDEY